MRKLPLILLAFALLAPATADAAKAKTKYYLALGDSLAAGIQREADGTSVLSPKKYVNQLYAKARKRNRKLKLVNLGCPGENIKTFTEGGCPFPVSDKQKTSQLAQAKAFLKKNRKRTAFITISLGANEVTPCATPAGADIECALAGLANLKKTLPAAAAALRKAAGKKVRIVTHTQYNPFLALYLRGGSYADLALASVELARNFNVAIRDAVAPSKFKIADVATAFKSSDLTTQATLDGAQVPLAVERTCTLTQMCLPAPQGNIHPSDAGYTLMASTFAKVLKIK